MVIELFVGSVGDRFAAWSPMFPGMVSFSEDQGRAVRMAREACVTAMKLKRALDPRIPDPDLIDWVPRRGSVPKHFGPAFYHAISDIQAQERATV